MPRFPQKFAARLSFFLVFAAVSAAAPFAVIARADDAPTTAKPPVKAPATKQDPKHEAADQPAIKGEPGPNNGFVKRHEGFLKDLKAKDGKVGVLFVGDSITDGWRGRGGKEVFEKSYGKDEPLNLGIGGDRTQHVIWRLQNGEVEGISPKVTVVMIGTNNLGSNTNDEIAAGVTKVVTTLHEKLPKTKVLLLGIFPRGAKADDPNRARIKSINEQLAKLDDGGKTVKYLDIGPKFLAEDGELPKDVMPDALHPNAKGYEIWAEAMQPTLDELMK